MTTGRDRIWMVLLGFLGAPALTLGEALVDQSDLEGAGLRIHWTAQLPLGEGDTVVGGFVRDEVIYVTTDRSKLYSITADSGLIRWVHAITEPDYDVYPPSHVVTMNGEGAVVVRAATETFIFDRFTGRQLRRFRPRHIASGPALAVDDLILAGSTGNRFYATRVAPRGDLPPQQLWEAATDAPITTQPLLFDGDQVLFASRGGTVYACRADDKTLRFSTNVGGSILGDPAVDATGAYVASTDRSLYKLDITDGRILWRARFEAPLTTGPSVVDGVVFQRCNRNGLTALDADTGNVRWRVSHARTFAAHTRAGDVLLSADHDILLVSHDRGEVLATIPSRGVFGVATPTYGDALYLLGHDGRINALRLGDVPYLKRQQIMAARSKLNQRPVQTDADAPPKPPRANKADNQDSRDPLRSKRDRG